MDHFLSGLDGHNAWYANRNPLHPQGHEFAVGTNSFQLIPIAAPGTSVSSGSSIIRSSSTIGSYPGSGIAKTLPIVSSSSINSPSISAAAAASIASVSKVIKEEIEVLEEGRKFSHLDLEGFSLSPMKMGIKSKDGKKIDARRVCNICGKILSRGDKLKNHIRIHTNNFPYHCDTCGQGFLRAEGLRIHTRIHTGERPYVCIICGKAYTRKDKLTRHAIVHTGERPFVCQHCGKSFTRKDKMQRHELIHKVEKPWTCVPCNLEFVRQEGFNAHMEKKHPERLPYTLFPQSRPLPDSPPSPGYLIPECLGANISHHNSYPLIMNATKSASIGHSGGTNTITTVASNSKSVPVLPIPTHKLPLPIITSQSTS